MTFKVGKRYKDRFGEIVGPLEAYKGPYPEDYAFMVGLADRNGYTAKTYRADGGFFRNGVSDSDLLPGAIEDGPTLPSAPEFAEVGEEHLTVQDAQSGDVYVDANGKLWRVMMTCPEPTVRMIEVEPSPQAKPVGGIVLPSWPVASPETPSRHLHGGISGAMWSGFKRIYRPEGGK